MAKAKEKYIETLRSQKVDQLEKMLLDEREAQFSNRIKHKACLKRSLLVRLPAKVRLFLPRMVETEP